MPKKTKKEKIIAAYRRKLSSISSHVSNETRKHELPQTTSVQYSFTNQQAGYKQKESSVTLNPQEFLAIKKDLLTTLGITIFIFIGQIAIWKMMR